MKKRYKMKKKYSVSVAIIVIVAIATALAMNIGYSLFGSKLNIYGKVNLKSQSDKLEMSVLSKSENVYTEILGIDNSELEFISDEYVDNTLTTTFRKEKDVNNIDDFNLEVKFILRNDSSQRKDFCKW